MDAFDEVARVGDARIYDILYKIRDAEPDRVLLSSRSGEWEDARTRLVQELFGKEPQVVHLVPLNNGEQRQLFEHFHPRRSFDEFNANITRFDLHHILGNPEFLRLFARAYDEADGRLFSRGDVFTLAIENLARESNPDVSTKGAPARQEKIRWANEIFSKLLLSGMDGVAVGDIAEDDLHPQMDMIGLVGEEPLSVLGTRLFRPGSAANQHEPVHRIVAEYGAAQHIVSLIDDPACGLTVGQCFGLIAPNGAVRDDLRGLLGWMAALGSENLQSAAIELDPYAVLSNGDPSRLPVEKRVAGAQLQPTFLMAQVEVVATYELYNINQTRLENLIHRIFVKAQLDIQIADRFGRPTSPREWFLVPLFVIDNAVEKIRDGTITGYEYDPERAELVER